MVLQTSNEDIILRPLTEADAKAIVRIANNKNIWLNLRDKFPNPYTEKDANNFIRIVQDNPQDCVKLIEYAGYVVGLVSLHRQSDVYSHSYELGYFLDEQYWGQGIGGTAVKRMVTYGFESLKIHRIFASVFDYNPASMRILEKCGFVKEGVKKEAIIKEGRIMDEHFYGLLNPGKRNP